MKSNKRSKAQFLFLSLLQMLLGSCSKTFINTPLPSTSSSTSTSSNVMQLTVNGSTCGSVNPQYFNEPCVSVTLCQPGTANCQTIDGLLLDTGSSGLRIFQSAITVPLTPVMSGSNTIGECVQYGDGTSQWGPVQMADLKLGGEPTIRVPILAINQNFSSPPSLCTSAQGTPDLGPQTSGYNGILGMGLFAADCGSYCATNASNNLYYSCSGSTCTSAAVAVANQVTNPVSLLPQDNNGVILKLPSIPASGAASVTGSLVLGIGTQTNNTPSGVTAYKADSTLYFSATFSAYSSSPLTSSFIDSGTNVYAFPAPTSTTLPDCNTTAGGSHGSGWAGAYCPSTNTTLSALATGASGSPSGTVSFQIGNFYNLLNSGNAVFLNVGEANASTTTFDFGLPFFFGKNVYVGIENTRSSLGLGPYWAY